MPMDGKTAVLMASSTKRMLRMRSRNRTSSMAAIMGIT